MTERARALVVGANGFIGAHLVDGLSAAGYAVTAFDRFSLGTRHFSTDAAVVQGDFLNRDDLRRALEGQEFLFHFLSTSTPATAANDPTFDVRTNVLQTIELMELAVEAGVKHVFFASTGGAIYGDSGRDIYSEDAPTLPISPYAIGKLSIENYLRYFRVRSGIEVTSFRISNPFGPGQHGDRKQGLIPIALRHVLRGEAITQLGDGSMVRDYVFVNDLVQMILRVAEGRPRHDVYNLGSGEGRSVSSVLEVIREVTGVDLEIKVAPQPATFVDRITLDTSRFVSEFGQPELTNFREGVRKTWEELQGK